MPSNPTLTPAMDDVKARIKAYMKEGLSLKEAMDKIHKENAAQIRAAHPNVKPQTANG